MLTVNGCVFNVGCQEKSLATKMSPITWQKQVEALRHLRKTGICMSTQAALATFKWSHWTMKALLVQHLTKPLLPLSKMQTTCGSLMSCTTPSA